MRLENFRESITYHLENVCGALVPTGLEMKMPRSCLTFAFWESPSLAGQPGFKTNKRDLDPAASSHMLALCSEFSTENERLEK